MFLKRLVFAHKYKNVKPNKQRTDINCKRKNHRWLSKFVQRLKNSLNKTPIHAPVNMDECEKREITKKQIISKDHLV